MANLSGSSFIDDLRCPFCLIRNVQYQEESLKYSNRTLLFKLKDILVGRPRPSIFQYRHSLIELKKSEPRDQWLSEFFKSKNNYLISEDQHQKYIEMDHLYLCENHISDLHKSYVINIYYCIYCGEEYSIQESAKFEFVNIIGHEGIKKCRGCKKASLATYTVNTTETKSFVQICRDCKKVVKYKKDEFGGAHPRFMVKGCSFCGSSNLLHIEKKNVTWSKKNLKERIKYVPKQEIVTSRNCSKYHFRMNDLYCPFCRKELKK